MQTRWNVRSDLTATTIHVNERLARTLETRHQSRADRHKAVVCSGKSGWPQRGHFGRHFKRSIDAAR